MNLLREKNKIKKDRRNLLTLIIVECLILFILLSWQYLINREELMQLTTQQEILQESKNSINFTEKVTYGERKKMLEAIEDGHKTQKTENDLKHQEMLSTLDIIQGIAEIPFIDIYQVNLEENLIEIKGSASKKSDIENLLSDLILPHYGSFEPLEYDNYSQDHYRFVLKKHLIVEGGLGDE